MTKTVIIGVLDEIRKPNGNKRNNDKTFAQIVSDVWNKLGLEGEPNPTSLERLLINLILAMYDDNERVTLDEEKRYRAKQRDFSLLMFGLLDGYYHTTEKDGKKVNVPSEERYERYLDDGYFIKLDYPGEGTYQEIKIKDKKRNIKSKSAQSRPLNKLTKIAGECKVEIGGKLSKLIKDGSYKQYIGELHSADNVEAPIVLPRPYYTLENFPPIVATKNQYNCKNDITAKAGSASSADIGGQEQTLKAKERMPKKLKWQLIISSVLGGVIAGFITSFVQRWLPPNINEDIEAGEDAPLVEEIYVFNNKFKLPVGEKETLVIVTNPPDADMDSVRCVVDRNPELVMIENDYDVRAQSQEEWLDEAEHTAVVLVQGGHAEKFPVEVTVINPRIYEDRAKDNLPNSEY